MRPVQMDPWNNNLHFQPELCLFGHPGKNNEILLIFFHKTNFLGPIGAVVHVSQRKESEDANA